MVGLKELSLIINVACLILCKKNKEMIKGLVILSAFVLVIAALPLVWFFLLAQIQHQGASGVSHSIHFARGNMAVDFIMSAVAQLRFSFSVRGELPRVIRALPQVVAGAAGIATIAAVFRKNKMLNNLAVVCIASWLMYYIMTACSFYGYNSWNPESLGTNNIGGRYGLFLSPLWVLVLIYGTYLFSVTVKEKVPGNIWIWYRAIFVAAVFVF